MIVLRKYKDVHSGYILVLDPTHHRAKSNGYVAEHILIAEQMLGRKLTESEVVHHEDRNRSNNSTDNLFVFATGDDHSRYHKTGVMIKDGDHYISPDLRIKSICKICDKEFMYLESGQKGFYCSLTCVGLSQRRTERPSKEELFELIKIKSFVQLGKEYGVSDNAVRAWCKDYNLPYTRKGIKELK